jgi:hypothetical protein
MSTHKRFLTPNEVVELLAGTISASTLARWRFNLTPGSPPFVKIGNRVAYEVAAIERWLEGRRHDPGSS